MTAESDRLNTSNEDLLDAAARRNRELRRLWFDPGAVGPSLDLKWHGRTTRFLEDRLASIVRLAALILVTAGDIVLFYFTFKGGLELENNLEWQAKLLAVGLALAGLALARYFGIEIKLLFEDRALKRPANRSERRSPHRFLCVLAAIAWFGIGVGMTWARFKLGDDIGSSGGGGGGVETKSEISGGAANSVTKVAMGPILGILGAILFFASGVLVVIEFYRTFNPIARRLRLVNTQVAATNTAITKLNSDIVRIRADVERHAMELQSAENDYEKSTGYDRSLGEAGKHWARVNIARILGNPSASELIHERDRCEVEKESDPSATE